jgi:hypothetical protein
MTSILVEAFHMPDLKLIIGGGKPRDPRRDMARVAFRRMVVRTLRAVARGEDDSAKVVRQLNRFWEHLQAAKDTRPDTLITEVFGTMREDLERELSVRANSVNYIVVDALRVAAESCAIDDDARRRASNRLNKLTTAIERWTIKEKRRSPAPRRRTRKVPADDPVL